MLKYEMPNGSFIWLNPLQVVNVSEGTHGAVISFTNGNVVHVAVDAEKVSEEIERSIFQATRPSFEEACRLSYG